LYSDRGIEISLSAAKQIELSPEFKPGANGFDDPSGISGLELRIALSRSNRVKIGERFCERCHLLTAIVVVALAVAAPSAAETTRGAGLAVQTAQPAPQDHSVGAARSNGFGVGDGAFVVAANSSARDELFASQKSEVPERPVGIHGFYDFGLAYTYASPAHWSRALSRFRVSAEGALGGDVKYKIGGQVEFDPVYSLSHFYPASVRRDQRVDFIWSENYVDFSASDWDFRIGAQHIVWGEVVGLFFADVVSARDSREFLLPTFDLLRIPQWAMRAERTWGDSHLELIWVPIPSFDRIGKPGADFYPLPLPSPVSGAVESMIGSIDRPARKLSNSSYGLRANTIYNGWDVAAFYYRSFSTEPTFFRDSSINDHDVIFRPSYDRIWQGGATVTKDFDTFVLRGEAVYTHGKNFLATDPTLPRGTVQRQTLDQILSFDVPIGESRFNFQVFQRLYFGGRDDVLLNTGAFGVSAFASTKLTATIEPQILWVQGIDGGGGMVRPRVNWKADRNLLVAVGADIFTGSSNGFFGRYNNRDRVYTEVRYDF
jgi:hypothetical protein